MIQYLLFLILLALPLVGQDTKNPDPHHLYTWSATTLVAANSFDVVSSWGKVEANPCLRSPQSFGWQSTAIKAGVVGSTILFERYLLHKHPKYRKSLVVTNFVIAGAISGVAVHNMGVPK